MCSTVSAVAAHVNDKMMRLHVCVYGLLLRHKCITGRRMEHSSA
jgi:hypothetical protein